MWCSSKQPVRVSLSPGFWRVSPVNPAVPGMSARGSPSRTAAHWAMAYGMSREPAGDSTPTWRITMDTPATRHDH
ncbi:hypothetical protein SUDANB6_00198 [Streptomyces sp. enrichment culture]